MIEKTQKSGDISASINYLEKGNEIEEKTNYLNRSDSYQIRELYDYNQNRISSEKGVELSQNFKHYDIRIYNQVSDNLSKEDLHKMAKDIIDARNQQSGGKIAGLYAIHQRPDGTNKHLHIVFLSNNKNALEKTGRGNNWQKIRTNIELKYTNNELEKAKVIEYYNKALTTLKSRLTGTEKIDKFILTHMNKENGNFGLKRALISIQKSKSIGNKSYYIKRLTGRLNNLSKEGILEKIDDNHFKVNIEKFQKMIEKRANDKIEKNLFKMEQTKTKEKMNNLYQQKANLYNQQKANFKYLKNSTLSTISNKKPIIDRINNTSINLNQTNQKINETKLEILDMKLLEKDKINPFRGAEYLLKNTKLSTQKIREITEFQIKRLEQLKKRGLVEKKGSEYVIKDRQKFKEYLNSKQAQKDRTRLAKSKTTNKTIKSKVNNFINKNTKFRPVKDTKSAYYELSKAFGKSTGDKVIAFAVAVGYSVAKNSVKLAIKTAISIVKTITKTTSKTISSHKNKNFEKKVKNKNITKKTDKKNNKDEDKFLKEVEKTDKNKKNNNVLENKNEKEREDSHHHKR